MDDDYDTPWKAVVTDHFPEFMAFYFPSACTVIDWSRPHDFLDQELSALSRDAELGKRRLDKLLYQRGWDKRRIINLHRVIDWLMRLPKSLDKRLRHGILQLERRRVMPYITSYERIGMEIGEQKGWQKGLQEGQVAQLIAMLDRRFGALDPAVAERLAKAPVSQLSAWALNFVDAATLDQVFRD
jgi:hypothetical protein